MRGTLRLAPMAKKMGRPPEDRDDATARVDRGVLYKAQMVAKARKIKLAEYLTESLRAIVDADFLAEMERVKGSGPDKHQAHPGQ